MAYYPIAVDLTGRAVLVVGGGIVALRKIETLIDFGARVTVVSREVTPEIEALARSGRIEVRQRSYRTGDIAGAVLVVAATDDREVNSRVSSDARAANALVNVVDDPELCSFIVPAIVRRGDLTISISTAGKSPALARRIREMIEETVGPEYGELADLLGEVRELARERIDDQPARERVFRQMLDSEILDLLRSGRRAEARAAAMRMIHDGTERAGGTRI